MQDQHYAYLILFDNANSYVSIFSYFVHDQYA